MKQISKMSYQLMVICAFSAVTKTVDYHDFRKYYGVVENDKD